jgi:hypothetical protein
LCLSLAEKFLLAVIYQKYLPMSRNSNSTLEPVPKLEKVKLSQMQENEKASLATVAESLRPNEIDEEITVMTNINQESYYYTFVYLYSYYGSSSCSLSSRYSSALYDNTCTSESFYSTQSTSIVYNIKIECLGSGYYNIYWYSSTDYTCSALLFFSSYNKEYTCYSFTSSYNSYYYAASCPTISSYYYSQQSIYPLVEAYSDSSCTDYENGISGNLEGTCLNLYSLIYNDYYYYYYRVDCSSNFDSSSWRMKIYDDDSTCTFTNSLIYTLYGYGSCGCESIYLDGQEYSFRVNCAGQIPSCSSSTSSSSSLPAGVIAEIVIGATIGGICCCILLVYMIVWCSRRHSYDPIQIQQRAQVEMLGSFQLQPQVVTVTSTRETPQEKDLENNPQIIPIYSTAITEGGIGIVTPTTTVVGGYAIVSSYPMDNTTSPPIAESDVL